MIVSCPSCDSRYLVDNSKIGFGRHVKCTRCNHSWYFENKNFEIERLHVPPKSEFLSDKDNESASNSNLPVIYNKNKGKIPLPFLLLIITAIFVLGYESYESFDFNPEELNRCMNEIIDTIVNWVYNLFF